MSARSTPHQNTKGVQKKYVPKTQNSPKFVPKTHTPPLSTSLRSSDPSTLNPSSSSSSSSSSSAPSSSSSRVQIGDSGKWVPSRKQGGGSFVDYLPQDEAVAAGLNVEDGALDPVESQRVVDLLNRELARLLKLNPRDFWKEVVSDSTLHDFLDSFLQFRSRWYDFSHHERKGLVAGVIVGEHELSRRVFMVLYRITSNRDPGARVSDSLSAKEHGVFLQEKKLLDLPKLMDICAIYGHENEELTRKLVMNAMKAQPWLHENLPPVVSQFLNIVHTMHQRCDSSLEVIFSLDGHKDNGKSPLYGDFLEVMKFINDAVASLDAFVNAYQPAAVYFCSTVETSYESGDLLGTLARLHDLLLPSLQRGFEQILSGTPEIDIVSGLTTHLRILSMRIINLAWKLMDCCYLSDQVFEGNLPFLNATKMFPANVEDPVIRGDILVQTFREINEKASLHMKGTKISRMLLRNVEKTHNILSRLDELLGSGWVVLDNDQFQYVTSIVLPPARATNKDTNMGTVANSMVQTEEDAAITESKISQIKDIFPDYGKGFLAACLEAYNQNPEEVIQRILEGTLHEELQSMDISADKIPPPKSSSLSKKDKGKGTLVELTESPSTRSVAGSNKSVAIVGERRTEGISSTSPSLVGRYTRKARSDSPNVKTLDMKSNGDVANTLMLASLQEYEDEYDDSFDDLGVSVAESGFEVAENMGDRVSSAPGKSWGGETENSALNGASSKWNSNTQKKPQFYVKDGKNYSYKVSGSVAVANSREAAMINQSQKELINGLGRGGNLPMGAVRALQDSREQQEDVNDASEDAEAGGRGDHTSSRGRGRGRGRRGGGRGNNYRKDQAMKKHFAGIGGH